MQQESPSPARAPAPVIAAESIRPEAASIVRQLQRGGHRAYLVGGCVRDLLLGFKPKDFDLATSARPRQVKRLFRYSRIIGRRFKLVHVSRGSFIFEVATFRAPPERDGEDFYIRRDNVFGTEEQDAHRRDFTINGLFYDPMRKRLVDHVGGVEDLRARKIRTIGDPDVRLREDPVRILRAARFAGRLDFGIDADLREAIGRHREDLRRSAPPRVLEEFYRLLSGHGAAEAFRLLADFGALDVLLPELGPVGDRFFDSVERLSTETTGQRDHLRQSTLIAVLFSPPVLAMFDAELRGDQGVESEVYELLRSLALRFTVARRDFNGACECLAAQSRLARPPHGRSAGRFTRRECFSEALLLREILGPVHAEGNDPLPLWKELARAEQGQGPKKKKRRRRRGGRRRRRNPPLSPQPDEGKREA
jgi:poly(A) polymerase